MQVSGAKTKKINKQGCSFIRYILEGTGISILLTISGVKSLGMYSIESFLSISVLLKALIGSVE